MKPETYESPRLKPETIVFANLKLLYVQVRSALSETARLPEKEQKYGEELLAMARTLEGLLQEEVRDAPPLFEAYARLHARLQQIVRMVWGSRHDS